MKISLAWLQNYIDAPLPDAQVVADALMFHAFEIESIEPSTTLGPGNEILDVKVTADRGHDCLSHRGIAKELAAILKLPFKKEYDPFSRPVDLSKTTDAVSVSIDLPAQAGDPALCKRYIAGYIRGVTVGPSPEWLVRRLAEVGQQSINNVVDATNFIMFDIGQPLHAFDAAKLHGQGPSLTAGDTKDGPRYAIGVRRARKGEKLVALDKKEYTLNDSMLVIADANADTPIGVAGVKGGHASAIDITTLDVVIEAANFDGASVRKTAQQLKLRTDASQRFEQQISPELAGYGMRAAAELILQLAGGEIVGFVDEYLSSQEPRSVSVSLAQINDILGTVLSEADVTDVFSRLGFTYNDLRSRYEVLIPSERLDLAIAESLAEEVGRIIGYDKVPAVELLPLAKTPEVNANFFSAEHARQELRAKEYSEVFTSVFADKGERVLVNKATPSQGDGRPTDSPSPFRVDGVHPYLRDSLVPGLTEALQRNTRNKDLLGLQEVKLFEIGTVWKGGKELLVLGTADARGVREEPLTIYEVVNEGALPLSATERYQPFSKYPFIVRDIALWVPAGSAADEVLAVIREHSGSLLVRSEKFDEFVKGDKVSYAFRLVFQSFDRTLVDEDAGERMEAISAAVKERGWEVR